jgi:hypothetical protein
MKRSKQPAAAAALLPWRRRRINGAVGIALLGFILPAAAENAAPGVPPQTDSEAVVKIDAATKSAIQGGLKFLASRQRLNGSWAIKDGNAGHPVAVTSYVLLAMMAAGNLPDEGEYARNMAAGVQFLLDRVQPDGLFRDVLGASYMYNHGMATIALAELYGESHAPSLRPKLQAAISVILKSQNAAGGWRYAPRPSDADVSVTVMQTVALRAAQEAGISIPQEPIDRAAGYVRSCFVPASGGFAYQARGTEPGYARTAAAIYALQVMGKYDDPMVKAGSAYLVAKYKIRDRFWFYGSYYAAPAQYMIGGDVWRKWYGAMKEMILPGIQRSGDMVKWKPGFAETDVNDVLLTAVNVHILAMPNHYLPLYQR